MSELLVVRAKLKEYVKGMNVSGELGEALSKKVEKVLADAVERAQANKRKTVMPYDL